MAPKRKPKKMPPPEAILAVALGLAEERGWMTLRMADLAAEMDASLADIHAHYPDMNAIANAWFLQAQDAMLAPTDEGFRDLAAPERLYLIIMRWLNFLAQHRQVSADMIRGKLHPPHVHHWGPALFSLSRLVHWMLDAAAIGSTGYRRRTEEVGLSVIVLATLARWASDGSEDLSYTQDFLRRRLAQGGIFMARVFGGR